MSLPRPQRNWALFLDFDGTLVDIADRPDAIRVDPGLPDLLRRVAAVLDGALAVVTGRSIADVDAYLQGAVAAIAGLHGIQRRHPDGSHYSGDIPHDRIEEARQELQAFASANEGVLLEDKGASLVLHYRLAPGLADACKALTDELAARSDGTLMVQPGKMVCELKAKGHHKGQAVLALLELSPFHGRTPVFAGDDLTDEVAFAAVNELGGISIRVGEGVETAAQYVVADVAELKRWLDRFPDGAA